MFTPKIAITALFLTGALLLANNSIDTEEFSYQFAGCRPNAQECTYSCTSPAAAKWSVNPDLCDETNPYTKLACFCKSEE